MLRVALGALLGLALAVTPTWAAKLALVIGNADYRYAGELANTISDADAFADFLRGTGYTVTEVRDGTRSQMASALSTFTQTLRQDDTAVFYYAGHGMQMDGQNYLVGTEAQLQNAFDVPAETVGLDDIIASIDAASGVAMFFIDACRDDPLADNLARTTRGVTRGLAAVPSEGDGAMVAFAASPGQVAYDGIDGHSAFTHALISHLGEQGVEVSTAFKRVIKDVRDATLNKQTPQMVSSLISEVYFDGVTVASTPSTAPAAPPVAPAIPAAPVDQGGGASRAVVDQPLPAPEQQAELATPPVTPPAAPPVDDGANIALATQVQQELKRLGCYVGVVDGQWGAGSRKALAAFASASGKKLDPAAPTVATLTLVAGTATPVCKAPVEKPPAETRQADVKPSGCYDLSVKLDKTDPNGADWDPWPGRAGNPDPIVTEASTGASNECADSFQCSLHVVGAGAKLSLRIIDDDPDAPDPVGSGTCTAGKSCRIGSASITMKGC